MMKRIKRIKRGIMLLLFIIAMMAGTTVFAADASTQYPVITKVKLPDSYTVYGEGSIFEFSIFVENPDLELTRITIQGIPSTIIIVPNKDSGKMELVMKNYFLKDVDVQLNKELKCYNIRGVVNNPKSTVYGDYNSMRISSVKIDAVNGKSDSIYAAGYYVWNNECINGNHTDFQTTIIEGDICRGGKEQKICSICRTKIPGTISLFTGFGGHNISQVKKISNYENYWYCNRCDSEIFGYVSNNVTGGIKLKVGQSTDKIMLESSLGNDKIVAYKSLDETVAKVNSKGKVTGEKVGRTRIDVTFQSGIKVYFEVNVQKKAVVTSKIAISEKKITLQKGQSHKLKPVVTPITTSDKLTYSSSNKKVVTVNSKGKITAKKSGTATITIKSGKKSVKVKVTVPKMMTTAITNVPETKELKKGKSWTIKAKLTPAKSEEKITYKSSNSKIATVSSKGKVTAKKKGKVTITIKSGKVTVKCKVTVK